MSASPYAAVDTVIFDLDGTLIDSEPDLRAALNQMLASLGRRTVTRAEVVMMVGDGVPKLVERALRITGAERDLAPEAAVAQFLGFYEAAPADLSAPFPGAFEIVRVLKADGIKLGICTNKPEAPARDILAVFGFLEFFDVVIGGDTLADVRKPDPRPLAAAIEAVYSQPERAVMVGDSANDIDPAKALGMRSVAVSFGYSRGAAAALGADTVIDDFSELREVLVGLA